MRIVSFIIFFSVTTLFWVPLAGALTFNDPIVDAADRGDKEKVIRLLKQGYRPDSKGDFGVTPLMRAAFRGNLELVKLLIESGAYVNSSDIGGDTPLHLAARNGHEDVVKALLEYDAYIDIPDKEKWTPLMRAVMAKQTGIARLLVEKGANIAALNEMDESVIIHAAMIGKPEIMEIFLGDKNFESIPFSQRSTALEIAEKKGNEKVGSMLASMSDYIQKKVSKRDGRQSEASQFARSDSFELPGSVGVGVPSGLSQEPYGAEKTIDRVVTDNPSGLPSQPFASEGGFQKQSQNAPYDILSTTGSPIVKPKNPQRIADIKRNLSGYADAFPEEFGVVGVPVPVEKPERFEYDNKGEFFKDENFYSVQLGAFSSAEQARFVWGNLQKKNTDLLSSLSADILPDVSSGGGKVLYKLRSGRFRWADVAESTCSSLKSRNIDCLVVPGSMKEYASAIQIKPAIASFADARGKGGTPLPIKREEAQEIQPFNNASAIGYNSPQPQQGVISDLPWLNQQGYQPQNYPSPNAPNVMAQSQQQVIASPYDNNVPQYQYNVPQPQNYNPSPAYNNMQQPAVSQNMPAPNINPPYASSGSGPIDINPSAQMAYGQPQNYGNVPPVAPPMQQNAVDEQVRNMARNQFFSERGVEQPKQKRDYGDFYNQLGNQAQGRSKLSEAILVPNNSYSPSYATSMQRPAGGGAWLHIESFPNQFSANDYGDRMFRYDESLGRLNILLVNSEYAGGVALRVGPLDYGVANNLCASVMSGGLGCAVKGNGESPSVRSVQSQPVNRYWINLGTFADTPEAEYYWMFLSEDNGDILSALEYDMASAGAHGAFGDDAVQLRVGPFNAKGRAAQICNVMKYRNIACLVQ